MHNQTVDMGNDGRNDNPSYSDRPIKDQIILKVGRRSPSPVPRPTEQNDKPLMIKVWARSLTNSWQN